MDYRALESGQCGPGTHGQGRLGDNRDGVLCLPADPLADLLGQLDDDALATRAVTGRARRDGRSAPEVAVARRDREPADEGRPVVVR